MLLLPVLRLKSKQLHILGGSAKWTLIGRGEWQIVMATSKRLDELDNRLEETVSKWSRRKLLTIRTVLLILVASLSTTAAIGLGHLHRVATTRPIEVALELNGQVELSESQLRKLVTSKHLIVYWAGPQSNVEYLINASNPAAIVLTMLPIDRPPKGIRASYPQITTYIVDNAYQVVLSGGGNPDVQGVKMPSGNSVYYTNANPDEVYVGIPGRNIELQVFDPTQRLWLYLLNDPGRLAQIT